jgi:membrane protein insertase Oxa1/YidC/SpoIIIJ
MVKLPTMHLQRMPMFWINSGFLMYAAGAMFLFAFTTYLTQVLKDNLLVYWSFHNILSIISQLIIMVGLIYDFKNLNSSPQAASEIETNLTKRKSYE